jgi:uncharacterized protein GlcG (DUF336 family)
MALFLPVDLAACVAAAPASASGGNATMAAPADSAQLSRDDVRRIIEQAVASASHTASADGLRNGPEIAPKRPTRMVIAVVARDGKLLDAFVMPDSWVGSQDIAVAKARTAAFFSSNENALTSRIIGALSQPGAPLWGIGNSNQVGITGSPQYRNGIITFPGGVPLYKNGHLVGAVGVSGDAVDQDEWVAFAGAAGYAPGPDVVKLGMTPPGGIPTIP